MKESPTSISAAGLGYSSPSLVVLKKPWFGLKPDLRSSLRNSRKMPPPSMPASSRPWAFSRWTRILFFRSGSNIRTQSMRRHLWGNTKKQHCLTKFLVKTHCDLTFTLINSTNTSGSFILHIHFTDISGTRIQSNTEHEEELGHFFQFKVVQMWL